MHILAHPPPLQNLTPPQTSPASFFFGKGKRGEWGGGTAGIERHREGIRHNAPEISGFDGLRTTPGSNASLKMQNMRILEVVWRLFLVGRIHRI